MKRVIIFTNLPQRDKLIDEMIAHELRKKGFEVRVTNYLPRNREHVVYGKPDIVIIPEARCEYTIDFARQCMSWGITVVVRRTEGGTSRAAWDMMEDSEKETVIGAWNYDVDLEIVWSEEFKKLMAEHGYISEDKIFAAGAIPFDMYFGTEKNHNTSPDKKIMFATGWGHADRNDEYNVPEAPPGSPIHKDAFDRHTFGRKEWVKMIRKARKALPSNYKFYLRVKTGEYIKPYQEALADIGIKILVPCPAKVALYNTDLLIHAGSTLGLEAHLCDMPALSYLGTVNQVKGYSYPHVSPDFSNSDLLINAIKKIKWNKSNANVDNFNSLIKEFYGVADGKACKRAAERIAELELKPTCTPDEWPDYSGDYHYPGVFKQVQQWICECCRRPSFTDPSKDMIKCPHCGISLAKRAPIEQIQDLNWHKEEEPLDMGRQKND